MKTRLYRSQSPRRLSNWKTGIRKNSSKAASVTGEENFAKSSWLGGATKKLLENKSSFPKVAFFSFSFFCFTINTLNQLKFLTRVKRFRLLRMKLCYFFIRNGSKWGAVAEWYKSLHCKEKITKARLSLARVIFTKPWRIRLNSKRPMSPKHSQNDFRATDLFTWKRRLCQVCVYFKLQDTVDCYVG